MVAISWDDAYTVHVESIDTQHKKMMRLINDLHRIANNGGDDIQIEAAISGLLNYAKEHFLYEESFFEQYHYPLFKPHQQEHTVFLETIAKFKIELLNGQGNDKKKSINFMVSWLKNHITSEDKQYICFMLEHGVK
ncbi:MAG: hemerythrin family protein [SAR324 cluster bacterium]|nr:hemerythrin family protein [SAR324 cluster bacterium]